MKFKKDVEPLFTTDLYYDLFDGGYIKPSELLEPEDADKVNDAIKIIEQFLDKAEANGAIEIG